MCYIIISDCELLYYTMYNEQGSSRAGLSLIPDKNLVGYLPNLVCTMVAMAYLDSRGNYCCIKNVPLTRYRYIITWSNDRLRIHRLVRTEHVQVNSDLIRSSSWWPEIPPSSCTLSSGAGGISSSDCIAIPDYPIDWPHGKFVALAELCWSTRVH
jgi:hypothetical protein